MRIEAEIGGIWPQTKECQPPLQAGGDKGQILP